MKIITGGAEYAVSGKPNIRAGYIRIPLAAAPETLGDTVQLADNTGGVLRDITVADYLRWYTADGALIFTDTAAATEPTAEEIAAAAKTAKNAELNAACEAAITAGCDVTLSDGTTGHIGMSAEDQINLSAATVTVQQGAATYPYHLDGNLCAVYSAADIEIMAAAMTAHKLYHTTYCNHLHAWVNRCTAQADIMAITYGATLPEDLAQHMSTIIGDAS